MALVLIFVLLCLGKYTLDYSAEDKVHKVETIYIAHVWSHSSVGLHKGL